MPIAISDDHRALAQTVSEFLAARGARAAARNLLEAKTDGLPDFWGEVGKLGWLGLHLPEEYGGSGFGLSELVIVVEQFGRAVAPGPFVPTVIASAVIAAAGPPGLQARLLPGLASGSAIGAVALRGDVTDGTGNAGIAASGHLADVLLVAQGDDVRVGEAAGGRVKTEVPANLDPARRIARVTLTGATATVLPGARKVLTDLSRLLFAAEATGVAREVTEQAADYAKVREQFGRPIATFEAVKHHCANMLVAAELATAAVWDAARAADGEQLSYTAAIAATLAGPSAVQNAQLNIQVHAAIDVTDQVRSGVSRAAAIDLPPEAEEIRASIRPEVQRLRELDREARKQALIESGLLMPHWPKPWGRDAGAVEQLVIEQEFAAAELKRPSLGITGWVILTLIQYGTPEQVARWVPAALNQEVIWCQLFSEPGAGSDAAGIRTRATRAGEGGEKGAGWLINGQKVWTSGAQHAAYGFATVRTNPDAPKHDGITMVVIDMHAKGVTVRPLRIPNGGSEFNEVFFDDVFVPDDDVVGPVDGGWTVARATLGNESVSIGGGGGSMFTLPPNAVIGPLDAHPERLAGGAGRVGRFLASTQAMTALNLRAAYRAVAGGGPGPEGNITKLLLSENGHEAAAMLAELAGPDLAFLDGPASMAGTLVLLNRSMSIAGGTSEIKRNQIAERILGLPRDPLIR